MYIISIIFFVLAAICNSIMDKTDHHFNKSIFKTFKNRKWWYTPNSWKNKYVDGDSTKGRVKILFNINKPVQITDAWHFFKTLMIIFICISIVTYQPIYNKFIDIIIYGTIWNTNFSLMYNRILKKK